MKYTIPKAFYKVFEDIGNEVYEVSAELMDRELYDNLIKDMDKRFYWEDYKSNKEFDKDYIYHSDVRLLAKLISQLILFHRLVRTNSSDEKNNPQNEVPLFLGSLMKMENRIIYLISAAVRYLRNGVRNLKAERS